MATIVVNVKTEPYDVCIMRPGIYQNKYRIGVDGTREEVIAKFKVDFYERIKWDLAYLQAVIRLRDKRIDCCCAPLPCHGDIYVEFLDIIATNEYFIGIKDIVD